MKNITVLFEDNDFLVLNKPAGLPVQGGTGVGASLDSLLANAYKNRPFLVHRLDKDTSGVIVTAKTKESAAGCSALFATPTGLHKRYLAFCAGIQEEKGIISETLFVKGRELTAETSYRILACANFPADHLFSGPVSFLELLPATGRMHQIRRHLARINCPVLGDDKYGNFALNKKLHKSLGLKRLLLHAASINLPPSLVKGGIEVSAPLPEYFTAVLEKAGFSAGYF
jgi:23S rRNA pseudouridine955/2504/2580 synthase